MFSKRSTASDVVAAVPGGIKGRVFIVTGCSSGLGFTCAQALIGGGATLVMACRAGAKAQRALEELQACAGRAGAPAVRLLDIDLGDQASVRKCAAAFLALDDGRLPLHALVNNAGINGIPEWGQFSPGIESHVAVNLIGHFLLSELLHERLAATPDSRLVNLSSESHRRVRVWSPLPPPREGYDPLNGYAYSNLCRILWTRAKADRLARAGAPYPVVCLHPGVQAGTDMVQHMGRWLFVRQVFVALTYEWRAILQGQSAEQVAATQTWATVAPREAVAEVSGKYLNGNYNVVAAGATAGTWDAVQALGRPDAPSELARSPELAEEVFAFAQRHCGL